MNTNTTTIAKEDETLFRLMSEALEPCVSEGGERVVLQAIHYEVENGKESFVAAEGRLLFFATRPTDKADTSHAITTPRFFKYVEKENNRRIKKAQQEEKEPVLSPQYKLVDDSSFVGNYPRWRVVVPDKAKSRAMYTLDLNKQYPEVIKSKKAKRNDVAPSFVGDKPGAVVFKVGEENAIFSGYLLANILKCFKKLGVGMADYYLYDYCSPILIESTIGEWTVGAVLMPIYVPESQAKRQGIMERPGSIIIDSNDGSRPLEKKPKSYSFYLNYTKNGKQVRKGFNEYQTLLLEAGMQVLNGATDMSYEAV